MIGVLLDTSVLIADERKIWDLAAFLEKHVRKAQVGISAITASEFEEGVHRAPPGKRREQRREFYKFIVENYPVMPFDLETASTHAQLRPELRKTGILIGPHDLMIAATALHLGWEIATLNTSEFSRVPGLTLSPVEPYWV
ncbi:MAG: PIN domain-containing protein [Verrucomicrobiota bacterium]